MILSGKDNRRQSHLPHVTDFVGRSTLHSHFYLFLLLTDPFLILYILIYIVAKESSASCLNNLLFYFLHFTSMIFLLNQVRQHNPVITASQQLKGYIWKRDENHSCNPMLFSQCPYYNYRHPSPQFLFFLHMFQAYMHLQPLTGPLSCPPTPALLQV